MRIIVHDYEEFKSMIARGKPIHHLGEFEVIDEHGHIYCLTFRIYAISKDLHTVVFEHKEWVKCGLRRLEQVYKDLVRIYAKPLGSTEMRLIP